MKVYVVLTDDEEVIESFDAKKVDSIFLKKEDAESYAEDKERGVMECYWVESFDLK